MSTDLIRIDPFFPCYPRTHPSHKKKGRRKSFLLRNLKQLFYFFTAFFAAFFTIAFFAAALLMLFLAVFFAAVFSAGVFLCSTSVIKCAALVTISLKWSSWIMWLKSER